MNVKNLLSSVAIAILTGTPLFAAESEIPAASLGEIGIFAAYEKFRIYSEVCGEQVPESRAEFEAVMSAFGERMKKLGAEVLATDEFRVMRSQPVPASLAAAFEREFENTRALHRSRTYTPNGCRGAHENFKSAPDDHWKAGIAMALTELRETGRPFAPALQE